MRTTSSFGRGSNANQSFRDHNKDLGLLQPCISQDAPKITISMVARDN